MPRSWRRLAAPAALLAAGALAGCGIFQGQREPLPCPAVSVLGEAETVTRFRPGEGRDLTDVAYQGRLSAQGQQCAYDEGVLSAVILVDLVAVKGPAAQANRVTLPFFVAIVDQEKRILAKQVFDSGAEFQRGARRVGIREEIEQRIPLAGGSDGGDYRIVVGLQLEESQLEYNRQLRAR